MEKTAWWVPDPARLEDLIQPNISESRQFVVAKAIRLPWDDYENFVTDLLVDREFLTENADVCTVDDDGTWHCLLVLHRGHTDGVLVMPDEQNRFRSMAYLPNGADQYEE